MVHAHVIANVVDTLANGKRLRVLSLETSQTSQNSLICGLRRAFGSRDWPTSFDLLTASIKAEPKIIHPRLTSIAIAIRCLHCRLSSPQIPINHPCSSTVGRSKSSFDVIETQRKLCVAALTALGLETAHRSRKDHPLTKRRSTKAGSLNAPAPTMPTNSDSPEPGISDGQRSRGI